MFYKEFLRREFLNNEYVKNKIDNYWAIIFGLVGGYSKILGMPIENTFLNNWVIPGIKAGMLGAMGYIGKKLVDLIISGFKKRKHKRLKSKDNTAR